MPGITQVELCEQLNSSAMAMTGLLDRMESKNLIKRVQDPKDRRVKRIFLTDGALALKPEMEAISEKLKAEVRAGLTPQEIATAQRVLTTMKNNALEIRGQAQT
jgi:MarR family transcriptional regulator for hemolysin